LGYKITFKKAVAKDLKRIGKQHAKRILDKIDTDLAKDPQRFPPLTGQFVDLRRYRVGEYRVIFAIIDDDVLILHVQHRKNVYRKDS
jgi:mRNA interferase RelE/StbE